MAVSLWWWRGAGEGAGVGSGGIVVASGGVFFGRRFLPGIFGMMGIFCWGRSRCRLGGGLVDIWFRPQTMLEGHYWPMLYTSFWLEHKLWGYHPLGYHTVNVLLHALNALLIWRLLLRLAVPGAWLIAAVFAVHPVHVEPVAWVIARKDLLATLFYLLCFASWLRYRQQPQGGGYFVILALFAAGMLSKSFVITVPVAMLLCVWWQHGRIAGRDLKQALPLLAVGLLIAAGDLWFYYSRALIGFEYSFAERLVISAKALWFYVAKLLWPHPLLVIYPKWDVAVADWLNWLPLAAALAVAAVLWWAQRWLGRGVFAGAAFFAVTLSPTLGIANNSYMGISFVADRYQYLGSVGLTAVVVAAAVVAVRRLGAAAVLPTAVLSVAGRGAAVLVLAVCGVLTFQQARIYESFFVFFRHISEVNPGGYQGHYNLSLAYLDREEYEHAAAAARRAIAIAPNSAEAYQNLAVAMNNLERWQETYAALTKVLELTPRPKAENFYYAAYMADKIGLAAEAERLLQQSLARDAGYRQAHSHLLGIYLRAGRYAEALALQPQLLESLLRTAARHFEEGRYADALQQYDHALAIAPQNADVYFGKGMVLAQLARPDAAIQSHQQALALAPEHLPALVQLAASYYQAGRYADALALYRRIVALQPQNAEAYSNLGSALAQTGQLAEAVRYFERALAIDPQLESARTNIKLARERLGQGQ